MEVAERYTLLRLLTLLTLLTWCTLLTWFTLLTLPIMSYNFIHVFNGITLPEVMPLVLKQTG